LQVPFSSFAHRTLFVLTFRLPDVIRFNRVAVRSQLAGTDNTTLIAFHHALDEREGGMDFCRLARINASGSVSMELIPPPPEFETSVPAIQELAEWMKRRMERRLGGIPCQAQQIASIQAGMTLHLRANVEAVVFVEQQHQFLSKRKRFHAKRHRPPGCYATLGDYTGSIALFLDHRFVSLISTVHSAYRSHSGIDVAHCKAFRNKDDEVLLMPTDRCVVSIIERLVEHYPLSSEQTQNASQEETSIVHGVAKRRQQTQVTCTIRDMVVQGVSLAGQKQTYLVDDNVDGLHALLCLDELRYKDVLLVLEEVSTGTRYSTVATTNVIEKLLGDTPIDSWKTNINLQRIVVRLIRGVLEDNVRLSWTIEQQISVGASSREPRQQSFVADVELALF
jgi:hypothetical protein